MMANHAWVIGPTCLYIHIQIYRLAKIAVNHFNKSYRVTAWLWVFNEKISKTTFIAIIIAAAGIIFMCFDSIQTGTLFGLVNGLVSSLGFAVFTVTLRWKKILLNLQPYL